jgi:hypothetical protein
MWDLPCATSTYSLTHPLERLRLLIALNVEAVITAETLVSLYKTTRLKNAEGGSVLNNSRTILTTRRFVFMWLLLFDSAVCEVHWCVQIATTSAWEVAVLVPVFPDCSGPGSRGAGHLQCVSWQLVHCLQMLWFVRFFVVAVLLGQSVFEAPPQLRTWSQGSDLSHFLSSRDDETVHTHGGKWERARTLGVWTRF